VGRVITIIMRFKDANNVEWLVAGQVADTAILAGSNGEVEKEMLEIPRPLRITETTIVGE
jgi:hypothetical protein